MEIGSREWHRIIIDGSRHLGVEIDEGVTVQFSVHASELIRWNRKINLTAITDPRDIAIKHFLDSLAPSKFIPEEVRVLDMGSGGGFPGIPLKILKPSLSVLMIDGVRKKVNFLKHVLRSLKLEHIEALQIRAENLSKDPEFANSFDVIISRALSDLTPFVKNALPLLAPQGKIMAMKGNVDPEELNAVRANTPQDLYSLKIEYYRLPSMNALRSIVIIKNIV
jgi:16S rRNA (guanine527-N7)-methyltransferase